MVTGGARSGKSEFCEEFVKKSGKEISYIATAIAYDDEFRERIKKHIDRRPNTWQPIEAYKDTDNLKIYGEIILLDCVTLMVSNLMFGEKDQAEILEEFDKLIKLSQKLNVICVSNEVGMCVVPENALARRFRGIAGIVNQFLAKNAKSIYFIVLGIPMKKNNKRLNVEEKDFCKGNCFCTFDWVL